MRRNHRCSFSGGEESGKAAMNNSLIIHSEMEANHRDGLQVAKRLRWKLIDLVR